jgi:hypothetical protein
LTLVIVMLELLVAGAGQIENAAGVLSAVLGWAFTAALLVAMTAFAVPRLPPSGLLLLALACALLVTGLRFAWPTPFVNLDGWLGRGTLSTASPLYLVWGNLLYSGLFVGANALAWRVERTQGRLARAETERSRSETLFDQAQLASLQGAVDPAFVLRVLDVLKARYVADPSAADRLLDQLTSFLRLAMPAVRSGRSTLGTELALVRAYTNLCAALEPHHAGWQCEIEGALDDLAFPPLLLLPVVDALAPQAPQRAGALRIAARTVHDTIELSVHASAPAAALPAGLLHRLRVGLHALHGPTAQVVVPAAAAHADDAAVLTLIVPRAAQAHSSQPQPSGETSPWTHQSAMTTN